MVAHLYGRIKRPASGFGACVLLAYWGVMLHTALMGFLHPWCNWDMLGYIGSIIAWSDPSASSVHLKTLATAQASIPLWIYQQFLDNPLSASSDAFVPLLPMYQVKPLYTSLMWCIHQLGPSLPSASWIVSSVSFALLAFVLSQWRSSQLPRSFWLLLLITLNYLYPYPLLSLAHLSTPDGLCTLLTTFLLVGWLRWQSFPLLLCTALLAELARPDSLVLSSLLVLYFAMASAPLKRLGKVQAVYTVLLLGFTYLLVGKLSHNYSLDRWFVYSFIQQAPHVVDMPQHVPLATYWAVLSSNSLHFLFLPRTMTLLVWSLLACLAYAVKPSSGRLYFHLLIISWLSLMIRFILYPSWDERYYFPYFLIQLMAGGEMLFPYLSGIWKVLHRVHREIISRENTSH